MKKYLYVLAIARAGLCVSCNKDKTAPDPAEVDFQKGGTVLKPTEQQTKVENTAVAVIDAVNPQDFSQLVNLIEHFVTEYCNENVDFSEVEAALGKKIESAYTYQEVINSDTKEHFSASYFETLMLQFSTITGKIEANSTKWTYEESDKLTISFKDADGKPCLLEATAKGELGYLPFYSSYDYFSQYNFDEDSDGVVDYDYYEVESTNTVMVNLPEEFNYTLSDDGTELMKASYVFKTNIASITDQANVADIYFDGTAVFEVVGYKFELRRAFLDMQNLEISSAITKGNQIIISEKAAINDFAINAAQEIGFEGGKFEAKLNVLGEVQLYCEVPQMDVLAQLLNEGPKGDSVEAMQAYLDSVNGAYKLEIHFDNTAAVQGRLELRIFVIDDEITVRPVIVFNDGSSYALEDYFNGEMLERIEQRIQQLVNQFEALITTA